MDKQIRSLLIGLLSLFMWGIATPSYAFGEATFYYKIAYCVNETGAGTVYANGPLYENQGNTSHDFTSTSGTSTQDAVFSKHDYAFLSTPSSVTMYYSLHAVNSNENYQFDHWEKKNGSKWEVINEPSLIYDAPSVTVTNSTNNDPNPSAIYKACFSLKGVLKAEVAVGQENLGHVMNSKVNNKAGDVVTLTAQSTQSFQGVFFSHWTIDGNDTFESTENPLTVTVPNVTSIVYRAHFTEPSEQTYCRFENVGTGKFISLSSLNNASVRKDGNNYTALIMNGLKLISNSSSSMGDPSTVFYIGGTSDNADGISPVLVLNSQGEDLMPQVFADGNNSYSIRIKKEGQYYRISTTMTVNTDGTTGEVFLTDEGSQIPVFSNSQGNNALWKIHFLDEGHVNEHAFGVAPDSRMEINGKYYTTLYTKFPYKMLDGIKAYYLDINKIDDIYNADTKKITFLEVDEEETIPKNMAVILECSGTDPKHNRLLPIVDINNSIPEGKYVTDKNNLLKGALVVGGGLTGEQAAAKSKLPNQDYVYVYSAKNGLVSFYTWTGTKVIPNNKVYLAVTKDFEGETSSDGNAAKGYTFVYGNVFEEVSIATSIDHPAQTEEDGVIYNLQGYKVTNPSAGVYIKNGKKYIVK